MEENLQSIYSGWFIATLTNLRKLSLKSKQEQFHKGRSKNRSFIFRRYIAKFDLFLV